MNKAFRVIRAFFGIMHPQKWGVFVKTYEATKFDHAFDVTWSQVGEDIGLAKALYQTINGKYVDVGAHHPSRYSVTRRLFSEGWSGVNIDANKALIEAFNRNRPNDVNLWGCVGTEKEYELTVFEEPAISTVNKEWETKFLNKNQRIAHKVKVPGITLAEIFEKYFENGFPNLLTIDAEGADLEVLKSANLSIGVGPEWLLLEADPPLSQVLETPAVKFAMELGYELYLILGAAALLRMKL